MTVQLQETPAQHNARVTQEAITASQRAAKAAREARLPTSPAEMKTALQAIAAAVKASMPEDVAEYVRRVERDIEGKRAELRRQREAREKHEATMAGIRKAALDELARHIVIPTGDARGLAAELLNNAATGGSDEWKQEILVARTLLEVAGLQALAAWTALQLSSTRPLWS